MTETKLLNTWKEIASYLGRGVRTVQRWEVVLHLPIRRPHGRKSSAVIAYSTELDEWLLKSPSGRFDQLPENKSLGHTTTDFRQNELSRERVHDSLAALRQQVARLRQEMDRAHSIVKKVYETERANNVFKEDQRNMWWRHDVSMSFIKPTSSRMAVNYELGSRTVEPVHGHGRSSATT
jgi:hypothetical protein